MKKTIIFLVFALSFCSFNLFADDVNIFYKQYKKFYRIYKKDSRNLVYEDNRKTVLLTYRFWNGFKVIKNVTFSYFKNKKEKELFKRDKKLLETFKRFSRFYAKHVIDIRERGRVVAISRAMWRQIARLNKAIYIFFNMERKMELRASGNAS